MTDPRVRGIAGAGREIVAAFVAFYGFCAALFVVLHVTVGERLSLIAFLNNFMPLLILPALPLALVCLLFRRWGLLLTLLPAAAMFAWSYGGYFMPNRVHASGETTSLTLLTFNLHAGRTRLQPLVNLIRDADADVVTLQELSPDAARVFADELADRYPYRALHPDRRSAVYGQGVLSKFPIGEDTYWQSGLGHQRITLDVGGRRVVLYNVHPYNPFVFTDEGMAFDPQRRARAVEDILQHASADAGPLILAGDFNMTDQTGVYQQVASRYRDTFREVGWGLGLTFPNNTALPSLARIDYVFHDDTVQSVAARAWPTSGGSDHRPVWVRLSLSLP